MVKSKNFSFFITLPSFFIGLCLDMLPSTQFSIWAAPKWSLLILIYWIIALPFSVGIFTGFCLGILLDLLTGSLLGEHAFGYIIISYIVIKFARIIKVYPVAQQMVVVLALITIYQSIIFIIQKLLTQAPYTLLFWMPIISSALAWPLVFIVLKKFRYSGEFC